MRCFLFILSITLVFGTIGQTISNGIPYIVSGKIQSTSKYISLPTTNNQYEIEELTKLDASSSEKIYRFGLEKIVSIDFFNEAEATYLPSGNIIYQLGIESKKAISLNLIFDDFFLANGTYLYLVDPKNKKYIGAYSNLNNNRANALGTEIIKSDKIILEVFVSKDYINKSTLRISKIIHGYNDIDKIAKALNNSGSCQIDVNCPLGQGWENQRNSVAMMVNGGGFCTGTLVHNTSGNEIPYFLSARHCGTDPTTWVFRFRYESPQGQADCGTSSPSVDGPTNMSINGASLCASFVGSDFMLSLLNFTPDPNWGIYYSGWDRRNIAPILCTGIHHPSGDVKKISQDKDEAISSSFNNIEADSHWKVPSWDNGATEGGSSGSPLFDQNQRIVGQLQGGNSHCGAPSYEMNDDYGKFSRSWTGGGTDDSRLSNWLDPNNIAPLFIDGYDPLQPKNNIDASISTDEVLFSTVCGDSISPQVTILNNGLDTLFQIEIHYGFDGDYSSVYQYSDTLITFETYTITLPDTSLSDGSHLFNAAITLPNHLDENTTNDTSSVNFAINSIGSAVFMELSIPCYASENTWSITLDGEGIIAKGGPYADNLSLPILDSFCLTPQCYTFNLNDSYGDGIVSSGCANGSLKLTNKNGEILLALNQDQANFGSLFSSGFCASLYKSTVLDYFKFYPNPVQSILSISVYNDTIKSYSIYDLTGHLIQSEQVNALFKEIDFNKIAAGYYLIEVITNQTKYIRKISHYND